MPRGPVSSWRMTGPALWHWSVTLTVWSGEKGERWFRLDHLCLELSDEAAD